MTDPHRRRLLGHALAALLLPLGPGLAQAEEAYPSRPIKWVLPYLAGTGPDITSFIPIPSLARPASSSTAVIRTSASRSPAGLR